mgnify:CR=1 FL=1
MDPVRPSIARALVLGLVVGVLPIGACTDRSVHVRIDRGVHFTDVTVGTGTPAAEGDFIELHYTVALPDGKVIIDTKRDGRSHRFTIGDGSVVRGLDTAVRGMRVGGERRIIVSPDSHVGRAGYGDLIPPNTRLTFDVRLLSMSHAAPPLGTRMSGAYP